MDSYNQHVNNSLLFNYTNQLGQITPFNSTTIDPGKSSTYKTNPYSQESSNYHQQLISNNIYNNQLYYSTNKNSDPLKTINHPSGYNLNSMANIYQQPGNSDYLSNNINFQTQQWMQNHYFDPNFYNTSTPSCAPSTISNISYTSTTTNNPLIPFTTNSIENEKMSEKKLILQNEVRTTPVLGCDKNLPSTSNDITDDCRGNILNNLLDDDIELRSKAYKIIKYLSIERESQAKPFIKDIMNAINNDMATSIELERLLECLCHLTYNSQTIKCIINLIIDNNLLFIDILGKRIIKDNFNRYGYGYYALSILHAILSLSDDISKVFIKYSRKAFIIDRIFDYLKKILSFPSINLYNQICYFERKEIIWIIGCIKYLIYENDSMKEYSLTKNGIKILLKIVSESQREYIHYHTLSCINAFIQSGSIKYVIEFVKNDIIKIIFSILTTYPSIDNNSKKIGSERVIIECYKIFCSILDADKMDNIIIKDICNIIFNNLTRSSIALSKYYTWFLCILSSKSLEYKILLNEKNIYYPFIFTINCCLEELKVLKKKNNVEIDSKEIQNIEEIFDNCLITFKNLTYHSQEEKILQVGIEKLFTINGSVEILINLFINSTMDANKLRIIIILLRGVTYYKYNEGHFQYLLDIIMKNMKNIVDIIYERSKDFNKLHDIWKKNLKDLLKKCIYFIKFLCLENAGISPKIRNIFRMNKLNLFNLIDDISDTEIKLEIIQLAKVLLNKEDNIVDIWLNNLQTQNTIKHCSESEDSTLRTVTIDFLRFAQETRCYLLTEESIECNGGISIASIYSDMC